MREITTLKLFDVKSNNEAVLVIRTSAKEIALCLSLRSGSDVEVRLTPENVKHVIRGLEEAVQSVTK